jgi:hypothetical protein
MAGRKCLSIIISAQMSERSSAHMSGAQISGHKYRVRKFQGANVGAQISGRKCWGVIISAHM